MTDTDKWLHADKWTQQGHNFAVEICRHHKGYRDEHGWCVYVYIREAHPLFNEVNIGHTDYYNIDAVNGMPLHGGCTFFELIRHQNDAGEFSSRKYKSGDVYAVKIGCDYSHLDDNEFSTYATRDDASLVFRDAQELYDWMKNIGESLEQAVKEIT